MTAGPGVDNVRIETAGDDPSGGPILVPGSFAGDYDLALVAAGDFSVSDGATLQAASLSVDAGGSITTAGSGLLKTTVGDMSLSAATAAIAPTARPSTSRWPENSR